jgi:hypothetical protein
LAGNMLWGVGGMFLAIPFVAILKIVFDRIEGLQPWGRLLGDEIPGDPSSHTDPTVPVTVLPDRHPEA